MQVPGGVGLVFRHDGDSACLHIDRIVPNGPADIGVLSAGDRLVAIDRIKINSSLEGEAPQLPGPHGTPVTLTFQRPANGPVFYDGCETHEFDMHLTRHRDFFPDTLAQQPDWPRPQGTFSDNDSSLWEHDVSCADSLPQSESADQNSKLVDEILKSISIPQVQGSGWGNEENVVPLPTVEDPWRHHGQRSQYGSLTSVERNTNTLALQQEVDGVKAQIMLLEDQIVREQDEMKRMKESSEQRIRALVDAQNADVAQISNLMATIDRQTAELQAARQGEIEPERLRTEWDLLQRERDRATVLSEENDAIWKSLELEITRAHSERDGLREKLREAQVELEKLTLQSQHEQEQDAKDPEKIALKKVLARAELTRKKTESLAQEIVRLRSEIRKAGGGGDKMPILEEELERLRDENRDLRSDQQSMQARKIGLEANDLSTFQSRSPQVTGQFRKSLSPALPQAQITSAGYLQKHQSPSHVKSTPPHLLNKSQTLSAQTKTPSETPASIPLPTTVTPHQVRLFSKLKAQPLPSLTNLGPQQMHRASCKVDIELNIPFSEVEQDNEAFIIQMRMNLADALESDIRYITVLQLKQEATSIIATVQLNPSNSADESAPSQKAMALAQQAVDPKSPLRNGLLTSFVVRVKNIQAVQGYVDSPLALIQVRVGSCRNIPVQDGLYESFVVIQVNENDFGITEKCEGEDPIFDQQFEGQVRVEQNAMISLCLHQQNVNGRDSLLGYVAVPLKRVMESRGENGWYDLRSPDSDLLVQGETGVAEVHLSFTVSVVAGTVPQQAETKEGFLIKRPVGMLDVLIGRARHLLHGIGRLVSCSLSVGSSNRKTRVVEARANAEWDEGFQLPIHAPDTDTLSIQLKDHVSSDDHTQDVLGMCSISVSQILRKMVQIGNGGESKPVSGWYALQTTDGGGNGTIQLLLSMHYRSTPESIPEPVVGWLRDYGCETGERESLQLFFVLDPFSQLLSGFSSEQAVQKLVPTVQYEVRGCTISGVSSQQESTQEIRFDLERHPRTKLQLAAPSKKEWEKWFDVLYRTGRILTLTNVFRDDIALSQDLQPSPDKDGRSNTSCDSIPDTATDGRHSHSSASPQTVIAHPHSLSLALPPTVTAIHRAPDSVSPPSLPATTASESEGRLLEIDKPDFLIELHLLKARNMPTTEERRDEQRTEARPLETYASVQFGSTTHSSQVSRSTSDPVWNESMRLTYSAGDKGLITIVFWGLPVSGGGGGERLSEDIDRQFDGKSLAFGLSPSSTKREVVGSTRSTVSAIPALHSSLEFG